MRILYILTTLGVGGAEKQVIDLAGRMASRGHFVTVVSLKHSEEEWPVKLPVLRLNLSKTPLGVVRGLLFARRFFHLFRPDLLHSHTYPANMFARMLRPLLGMGATMPLLVNTIHNVYEGGWHRMALYRLTGPLATHVTAVSEAAAEQALVGRSVARGKLSVLTNGIDTGVFSKDRSRRRRVRADMGVDDAFVWVAVGRVAPGKDYPNLLAAWEKVRAARPSARLWIAGEGAPDGLPGSGPEGVQWLGLRRDIPGLLDGADGYVLASAWAGMPLALGEAMSMEKAVVATDVGGVREMVGDTGMIVPAKDSGALAAEMLKVMEMGDKARKALGQAARRQIEGLFSMSAKADSWEELYSRLVQREPL